MDKEAFGRWYRLLMVGPGPRHDIACIEVGTHRRTRPPCPGRDAVAPLPYAAEPRDDGGKRLASGNTQRQRRARRATPYLGLLPASGNDII